MRLNHWLCTFSQERSKISSDREPYKKVETNSRAKFDKEIIAEAHRKLKRVLYYNLQADAGRPQDAQALFRLCLPRFYSGILTLGSG